MGTVIEIIDAVKGLSDAERVDLFGRLRKLGLEPAATAQRPAPEVYGSDEFTLRLAEHFHEAKRQALDAD